jgi:uncharacterized membrane protein
MFPWTPYVNGFWIFPLLCLICMVVVMFACGGMRFLSGHHDHGRDSRDASRRILDRRYAGGEIDKGQYDAMRRDLNE